MNEKRRSLWDWRFVYVQQVIISPLPRLLHGTTSSLAATMSNVCRRFSGFDLLREISASSELPGDCSLLLRRFVFQRFPNMLQDLVLELFITS
jgi:hypothetical protein